MTIEVLTNAWGGAAAAKGAFAEDWDAWGRQGLPGVGRLHLGPVEPASPWAWQDADVGWALLAPDVDPEKRALTDDLPEPLRQLVAERGGRVLRYLHPLRILDPVQGIELDIATPIGGRPGQLPRFLLLWGGPDRIPWALQFLLNARICVGRLDLEGEGLESYVGALRTGWAGGVTAGPTVVWSVRGDPMADLMDELVARPVAAAYGADTEWAAWLRAGTDGDAAWLVNALQTKPAVIVTTSHGCTGPAGPELQEKLGMPVAAGGALLGDLGAWEPDGAIWYAHACCSAGCASTSAFRGLFQAGSDAATAISNTEGQGDRIAPLPQRLLGAKKPLRAFVGHVEITMDWVLRGMAPHQQPLTRPLVSALYTQLGLGRPVGWAFADHFQPLGAVAALLDMIEQDPDSFPNAKLQRLYLRATAIDRMATVILGDPTVAL